MRNQKEKKSLRRMEVGEGKEPKEHVIEASRKSKERRENG